MKKLLSAMMALVLLVSLLALPVGAAPTATKKEPPKRAIAIVFDNSGSMYQKDDENSRLSDEQKEAYRYAWCRATYAMEVFATMMNNKDEMYIYPMHDIKVSSKDDNKSDKSYSSDKPLKITRSTASKIRKIITPSPGGTPSSTITAAYEGLKNKSADEKWLIVLTDGTKFDGKDEKTSQKKVQDILDDCAKKVNVAYLGIGEPAVDITGKSGKHQFISEEAKDSTEVLGKLTNMCNTIFGRDTLPNVKDTVDFNVSMGKLIVFLQGANISNIKLGDLTPSTDENALRYSEKGCDDGKAETSASEKQQLVDKSLQGVLLTYTDVPAGNYKLSYSGNATSVVCYYEPYVKVDLKLLNNEGVEVDPNGKLIEGEYSCKYMLVDGITGKPVESTLLGKTQYKFTVKGQTFTFDKAGTLGPVPVKANDQLDVAYEVTYLDGYTLSGDSTDFGWPEGGVKFFEKLADLKATISGGAKEYALSKLESSATFTVNFTYDGKACPEKVLKGLEQNLQVNFDGKKVAYEAKREGENFIVALKFHKGDPLDTDIGRIKMTVSSQYVNENGDATNNAGATAEFTIKDDSRALEMSVVRGQSYYQISEIPNSEPITIKLSYSGQPLTEAEMKATTITYEPQNVKLILEPDYKNSKMIVRLDPKNPPEEDDYDVSFTAKGKNEVGREQNVTKKTSFEVGKLPKWLKILIRVLIILAIILLILWWMTRKRLPKKLVVSYSEFKVGFSAVAGAPNVKFQGKGKKKGKITITSPNAPSDSEAKQSITMQVVALSPRYTPSKKRKIACTAFTVTNASRVKTVTLRNTEFSRDKKTGKFVLDSTGNPPTKPTELGYGPNIGISTKTSRSSVNFECKLTAK